MKKFFPYPPEGLHLTVVVVDIGPTVKQRKCIEPPSSAVSRSATLFCVTLSFNLGFRMFWLLSALCGWMTLRTRVSPISTVRQRADDKIWFATSFCSGWYSTYSYANYQLGKKQHGLIGRCCLWRLYKAALVLVFFIPAEGCSGSGDEEPGRACATGTSSVLCIRPFQRFITLWSGSFLNPLLCREYFKSLWEKTT